MTQGLAIIPNFACPLGINCSADCSIHEFQLGMDTILLRSSILCCLPTVGWQTSWSGSYGIFDDHLFVPSSMYVTADSSPRTLRGGCFQDFSNLPKSQNSPRIHHSLLVCVAGHLVELRFSFTIVEQRSLCEHIICG